MLCLSLETPPIHISLRVGRKSVSGPCDRELRRRPLSGQVFGKNSTFETDGPRDSLPPFKNPPAQTIHAD